MTTPGVKGQILNFSRRLSETTFDALSDANNGFLIRLASTKFLKNGLNSTIMIFYFFFWRIKKPATLATNMQAGRMKNIRYRLSRSMILL